MKIRILNLLVIICCIATVLTSCNSDEKFGVSVLTDSQELDPASETYEFDIWLVENFLKPYNLKFIYKMEDALSDMSYNLVPTNLDKSNDMAKLVKYLWFDAYNAVAGPNFIKENGPRAIHLIGSAAYNITSKTKVAGTAEGGIVVTLFECNALKRNNIKDLNDYYFLTMHHEFAHILHQKKLYPPRFNDITKENYSALGWNEFKTEEAYKRGFVSPYAMSAYDEDFVETIARYLLATDNEWKELLNKAKDPANVKDDINFKDGKNAILQKLNICSDWLKSAWDIDINVLRAEIHKRQANINTIFEE